MKDRIMLQCEGYKMFSGVAKIVPKNRAFASFEKAGTWLYKPDTNCWYVNGASYPAEIVQIQEE